MKRNRKENDEMQTPQLTTPADKNKTQLPKKEIQTPGPEQALG